MYFNKFMLDQQSTCSSPASYNTVPYLDPHLPCHAFITSPHSSVEVSNFAFLVYTNAYVELSCVYVYKHIAPFPGDMVQHPHFFLQFCTNTLQVAQLLWLLCVCAAAATSPPLPLPSSGYFTQRQTTRYFS